MKYQRILLYLGLSFLWVPLYAQHLQPENLKPDSSSKIICLTYHITKTAAHPEGEIVLTNSKIVPGHLKQLKDTAIANARKGQFMVSLKNTTGLTVSHSIINNPLEERVEYMKVGGDLGDTTLSKSEADFTVRMPYYPGCSVSEVKMFKEANNAVKISSLIINPGK